MKNQIEKANPSISHTNSELSKDLQHFQKVQNLSDRIRVVFILEQYYTFTIARG